MGDNQPQAERRDAHPQGATAAPFRFDRARLLPPSVVAVMRQQARGFLSLSTRDKLLLAAVANRNTPTESGDLIAATVAEIEATLAKPEAEREADLAAVARDAEKRLAPFALILAQIDPTRRATVTVHSDGHAEFTPADAATARSTPCRQAARRSRKCGRGANLYNSGQIVVGRPQGRQLPATFDSHAAHSVQGCHSCQRGPGPHCITCLRVSRDDIRIKRTAHNVRPELTVDRAATENPGADAPQTTNLPEHIENALRLFLATVVTMPPVGLIYLAHRATRRPDTFADHLRQFVETMALAEIEKASTIRHRYGRATLALAWKRMIAANSVLAVFQTWKGHPNWKGNGGRKRKHVKMTPAERAAQAEAAREAKVAAAIDAEAAAEAPAADRTFDRRGEPFAADRDDAQTRYFFDDGSGTDW